MGVATGDLLVEGVDVGDVTLTDANCTSLTFDLDGTLTVAGLNTLGEVCNVTLDDEALVFNSGVTTRKGGGQSNLIYNSLCSICLFIRY
jgi:hypothetical protein